MFTNGYCIAVFFAIIYGFTACKQDTTSAPCQAVNLITPQSQCYDSSRGLTLVASGQSSSQGQFIWYIFPQSDTTVANRNIAQSRAKLIAGGERIVVPDSLLKNAPLFVVKSVTNCEGRELHSIYYSIVKRQSANLSCPVWQVQTQ